MNKLTEAQTIIMGAVCGDICGQPYEWDNRKTDKLNEIDIPKVDSHFTDDTVLTMAIYDCVKNGKVDKFSFVNSLDKWGHKYPTAGYGGMFRQWLNSTEKKPYNSFGNGSAMRISSVAANYHVWERINQVVIDATSFTHGHAEGIKGALATSRAIYHAKEGAKKAFIREEIEEIYDYDLNFKLDDIRRDYKFSATCQHSVPQAIVAFLESSSYEDCIRRAISIGGDSDTIACIAGGIAAAFYQEIPEHILKYALSVLPKDMLELLDINK